MTETVRFARLPSQGVIAGIDFPGFITLGIGVLVALLGLIKNGLLGALTLSPIWAGLAVSGFVHVHNQSLITYLLREVSGVFRKSIGATKFRFRPDKKQRPSPALALNIPGRDGRLYLYETAAGICVVWDALLRQATISCMVATPGLGLPQTDVPVTISDQERESLIFEWSKVLGSFTQKSHIERVCIFEQTRPGTVAHETKVFAESAALDNVSDYYETLAKAAETVVLHTSVLTLTFSLTGETRAVIKAAGDEKLGLLQVAELEIKTVTDALAASGFTRVAWLNSREWASWGRSIIDPGGQDAVDTRTGTDFAGVAPDSVTPMLLDENRTYVETDSAFHRTYWIAEWPRYETYPGFMSRLVFARQQSGSPVRHSFMLVAAPVQVGEALKKIQKQKETWQSNQELKQKRGKNTSAADLADWEALLQQETELIAGQGELRFSAFLTVTSLRLEDLEAEAAFIRSAATAAGLEPRLLPWQQAEALLNVAYPAGLGMR